MAGRDTNTVSYRPASGKSNDGLSVQDQAPVFAICFRALLTYPLNVEGMLLA
jgi:hypothetical protein